ncbi:nodulin homeobox-like [Salvia splendens]|uniref:nodulin homeobox-like n=1 Tax=Salvia splendens TaxID=180675 RepID=UPI001C271BA7|nr:nodulin homeobox-like isoform X2 [Salvia splendens]XP_042042020.1 nodulin homeobox-like [Salvia splendens]
MSLNITTAAESVSYLDEVASNTATQDIAKFVGLEVLALLKNLFNAPSEASYPKGQLELNAMRLADVFSDDSNFRSFIMINFELGKEWTEQLASYIGLSNQMKCVYLVYSVWICL